MNSALIVINCKCSQRQGRPPTSWCPSVAHALPAPTRDPAKAPCWSLLGNKAFFVRPWRVHTHTHTHTHTVPKRLSEAKLELFVSLLGRAWFREAESSG